MTEVTQSEEQTRSVDEGLGTDLDGKRVLPRL